MGGCWDDLYLRRRDRSEIGRKQPLVLIDQILDPIR